MPLHPSNGEKTPHDRSSQRDAIQTGGKPLDSPADHVSLPNEDGFVEWQEAPELAELIKVWFDLPQPVIEAIMLLVRASAPDPSGS